MKKIKIFLASSEELKQERLELADFVEHLNHTLEKVGLQVQLVKWEYLDSSMGVQHKQDDYNDALKDCEMCIVIYWTRFGMYTKTELDTAYNRLREGANPQKLYVYFKNEDENNSLTPELKEFRDSFPKEYGHFENRFSNIDTLKSQFLLQFIEYQSKALKGSPLIEVKDGKISMGGKTYVDLMNVPFVGNNDDYTELLEDIEDLREWLDEHEPDHRKYAEKAAKLREKEEKKEKMEASLWDTALDITRLSNQKCSERLQRAIDLFNKGDNKGANAILNEEEIYKDAENNINLIKLGEEGRKGLITNIEELKLKIKTLENEMLEGWGEEVLKIYEKILEYTKEIYGLNSSEYIQELLRKGDFYLDIQLYKEALECNKKALNNLIPLGDNDLIRAEILNNIGGISGTFGDNKKCIKLLLESLEIRKKHLNKNHYLLGESYSNLSLFILDSGEYKKALEYAKIAYEIKTNSVGCSHPSTGTTLGIMGQVYTHLGQYDEAKKTLLESIVIFENCSGAQKLRVSTAYDCLSVVYSAIGDLPKAIEIAKKALHLRLKFLGKSSRGIAISYNNLGTLYRKAQEFELSIEYKLKAALLFKELYDDNFGSLVPIYSGIGLAFIELQRYEEAIIYFIKAYNISEYLKDNIGMGIRLNRLGRVYALMGDKETAKAKFEEALTLLPQDHPEAQDTRTRLEELEKEIKK